MTEVTIDRELLELSLNGDEQQQAKARNKLRTLLGGQGAEEHEAVEVVGYLNESGTYYPSMDSVERYAPPGEWLRRLMTVAQHERILATLKRAQSAKVPLVMAADYAALEAECDALRQQRDKLAKVLEDVEREHELIRQMKNCEIRRSRGSFGIAVMGDTPALEWQALDKELQQLVDARRAALAASTGQEVEKA